MRDPKRIPKILGRLRALWEANPDLRLGQIVGNAFHYPSGEDPYYVEDEAFIKRVEEVHGQKEN